MSTTVLRTRRIDCPVDGVIELTEACCPVCTRPLVGCDGATHARWGYSQDSEDRSLCVCEHCPTDDMDQTPAFEVTWVDTPRDYDSEGCDVGRVETARLIGVFTAEGELWRDLAAVERELFRMCFPELAS